jgi:hypothetical protein
LDDLVLPGITRDSVISIAKEHISGKKHIPGLPDNLVFSERHVNMREVRDAAVEGRLLEVFGSGAAYISNITQGEILIPQGIRSSNRHCRHCLSCRTDWLQRRKNHRTHWRRWPSTSDQCNLERNLWTTTWYDSK